MSPLSALLLDWAITALWPIIGAEGMKHYSGILFMSAGLAVGLVCLSPWLIRGGRWRALFDRETGGLFFLMGLFSGVASTIYISALAYTTPANAGIVAQVEVLYSALLCAWLLKEPISLRQNAAGLLVMGGTGLVMAHDLASPRWKGDLMILATPWLFQLSHICAKRLPRGLDPVVLSGGRVFYGLLAALPVCAWSLRSGGRFSWEAPALWTLLLQGTLLSSVNLVLWYKAILNMDLGKASIVILSYPALTVLFSWLLGREMIGWVQLVGLALTFAGAAWTSLLIIEAQKKLPPSARVPPETAQV